MRFRNVLRPRLKQWGTPMSIMQKLGDANRILEVSRGANDFGRMAAVLLLAKGNRLEAAQRAEAMGAARVAAVLKAAVTAGSLSGWGSPLAEMASLVSS